MSDNEHVNLPRHAVTDDLMALELAGWLALAHIVGIAIRRLLDGRLETGKLACCQHLVSTVHQLVRTEQLGRSATDCPFVQLTNARRKNTRMAMA